MENNSYNNRQADRMNSGSNQSNGQKPDLTSFESVWITKGITRQGVDLCEQVGRYLRNQSFTSSQLRNIFGELRRIEAKQDFESAKVDFYLLRPKIAYAISRLGQDSQKEAGKLFQELFEKGHICVNDKSSLHNFISMLEAVVAFHKAAGGN